MPSTTTTRPAPDARTRRGPRWWWIVLVQLAGTWAAVGLGFYALLSMPAYGLFGVTNDDTTRALGSLAAIAACACLLSGPLFVWAVRRWRSRP